MRLTEAIVGEMNCGNVSTVSPDRTVGFVPHQRYKNRAQQRNIVEDHMNTANVWILRFVGTLEGTNLSGRCS